MFVMRAVRDTKRDIDNGLKQQIRDFCTDFEQLTTSRNRLLHAHPFTESGGKQRLMYKTNLRWSENSLVSFIRETEDLSSRANQAFHNKLYST